MLNLSSREARSARLIEFFEAHAAMKAELAESRERVRELNAQMDALLASKSWRVTRPLRAVLGIFQALARRLRNESESAPPAEPSYADRRAGAREVKRSGELDLDPKALLNQICEDGVFEGAGTWRDSTIDKLTPQNAPRSRDRSPLEDWVY